MRKVTIIIFWISFGLFLVSLMGSVLLNILNKPLQQKEIYANLTIGDKVGFDVNESSLIFGIITPDSISTRSVIFTNDNDFDVLLKIRARGNIAPLLDFEEEIKVKSKEQKSIGFNALAEGRELGDYEGYVEFKIYAA